MYRGLMQWVSPDRCIKELCVVAQSYGNERTASSVTLFNQWITASVDIANRDVVLFDDVLDTGATASAVIEWLNRHNPTSVRTCFMVRKHRTRSHQIPQDWVLFDIDDCWVVGAGLDNEGCYRRLPYVAEKP
jgi:hypoxanthine phosphoribosyltransferase